MSKGKTINVTLPEELYNKMKEVADRKGLSVAALIRYASAEYLEKESKK